MDSSRTRWRWSCASSNDLLTSNDPYPVHAVANHMICSGRCRRFGVPGPTTLDQRRKRPVSHAEASAPIYVHSNPGKWIFILTRKVLSRTMRYFPSAAYLWPKSESHLGRAWSGTRLSRPAPTDYRPRVSLRDRLGPCNSPTPHSRNTILDEKKDSQTSAT